VVTRHTPPSRSGQPEPDQRENSRSLNPIESAPRRSAPKLPTFDSVTSTRGGRAGRLLDLILHLDPDATSDEARYFAAFFLPPYRSFGGGGEGAPFSCDVRPFPDVVSALAISHNASHSPVLRESKILAAVRQKSHLLVGDRALDGREMDNLKALEADLLHHSGNPRPSIEGLAN